MTLLFFIISAGIIYYLFIYKDNYKSIVNSDNQKRCPNCGNAIEDNFNVCPICKETLKRKCPNCGERVEVAWKYCPYCEKDLKR